MIDVKRLTTWLFRPPQEPRTIDTVILWWESRRLFYNLFILSTGLVSFLAFLFFITNSNTLKCGKDGVEPMALFAAPILINICYTAGWVLECTALATPLTKRAFRGPVLMRAGLCFSLFVVLLPTVVWGAIWVAHLVKHPAHPTIQADDGCM